MERRAYDIVQPDAGLCGLTELVRIEEMAGNYGVKLYPHSWHNGLMALAHAHTIAALPNADILEMCMVQGPLQWGILAEQPPFETGHLVLPDRPGFDVDLTEGLAGRFPCVEGHYAIAVER